MPESCTCGAVLVENARFCHRCGRPTAEDVPAAENAIPEIAAPVVAEAPPPRATLPMNFANPIALRVAFLISFAVVVLEVIPGFDRLLVIWWLSGGFSAALLYRRLTGLKLSVSAGARLGSLTGILPFVSVAVFVVAGREELFQQMAKQDPRMTEVLNNPTALATLFVLMLAVLFAMVVGTCAAGGALGARFAGRDNPGARLS